MKPARLIGMLFLAALAVVSISCSRDQGATDPGTSEVAAPELLLNNLTIQLLKCTPQGYVYAGQTIGAGGGTIHVGNHELVVPAGALNRTVFISMQMNADTTNSVKLLPEGLTFAPGKPAELTLSYANCGLVNSLLPKQIAYTTDQLQILRLLTSYDNKLTKKVSAPLQHFSRYAVAY